MRRRRSAPDDQVILAVPPAAAVELLPGLTAPLETRPIVNAHFRLPEAPKPLDNLPFLGIVGGDAQWLFLRGRLVSVTVSAATGLVDEPAEAIAARLWADVARALGLGAAAAAAPPDRQGEARDLRRDPRLGRATSRSQNGLPQSGPSGRLDRYRVAGHHRRRYPLGPKGRTRNRNPLTPDRVKRPG